MAVFCPKQSQVKCMFKARFFPQNILKLKLNVIADVIAMRLLFQLHNVRFIGHMLAKLYLRFMLFYWENSRGKTIGQSRAA